MWRDRAGKKKSGEWMSAPTRHPCFFRGSDTTPLIPQAFPGGSGGKESTCNAGDLGLIPGSGRSAGGGHISSLQYTYLKNLMDRGIWWATVHGVAKS